MDIEKLILLGRLEEIVVIDGVKFKLATPHYNGAREWGSDTTDALAIVCNMIEQIIFCFELIPSIVSRRAFCSIFGKSFIEDFFIWACKHRKCAAISPYVRRVKKDCIEYGVLEWHLCVVTYYHRFNL